MTQQIEHSTVKNWYFRTRDLFKKIHESQSQSGAARVVGSDGKMDDALFEKCGYLFKAIMPAILPRAEHLGSAGGSGCARGSKRGSKLAGKEPPPKKLLTKTPARQRDKAPALFPAASRRGSDSSDCSDGSNGMNSSDSSDADDAVEHVRRARRDRNIEVDLTRTKLNEDDFSSDAPDNESSGIDSDAVRAAARERKKGRNGSKTDRRKMHIANKLVVAVEKIVGDSQSRSAPRSETNPAASRLTMSEMASTLQQLKQAHDDGLLSDGEYEIAKNKTKTAAGLKSQ